MLKNNMEPSQKNSLNELDYQKILLGLGIAMAGAALTYIQDVLPGIDFGVWTPVVVALNSAVVNAARRFLAGV
jgi:hypothetical protein